MSSLNFVILKTKTISYGQSTMRSVAPLGYDTRRRQARRVKSILRNFSVKTKLSAVVARVLYRVFVRTDDNRVVRFFRVPREWFSTLYRQRISTRTRFYRFRVYNSRTTTSVGRRRVHVL